MLQGRQRRRIRPFIAVWEGGLIVQFCSELVIAFLSTVVTSIPCTRSCCSVDTPRPCRVRIYPLSPETYALARHCSGSAAVTPI